MMSEIPCSRPPPYWPGSMPSWPSLPRCGPSLWRPCRRRRGGQWPRHPRRLRAGTPNRDLHGRSYWPSAQRYSIATLRPSTKPVSCRPRRKQPRDARRGRPTPCRETQSPALLPIAHPCGHQLISCDCVYEELGIESDVVTKEQDREWERLLHEKGRIPFIVYPNLCAKCGVLWPEMFHVPDAEWQRYVEPA